MKFGSLLIFFLLSQLTFAQIKVIKLEKNAIPKSINYLGKIIDAVKYSDTEGEQIVITTQTGLIDTKDGNRSADLYAYHYLVSGDSFKLTWQLHDFVKDCPVDITASFIPNTFKITDLDKDGKAEVWLMYKTVCHGDVSPSEMKVIMHEGNKKFAMRGTNKVKVSDNKYDGGQYTFDETFKSGSELLRRFAGQLWKTNLMETWK